MPTSWYPLIVNTGSNQIQELPSGQDLNLSSSNISNVSSITVNSTTTAIVNGATSGVGNIGASGAVFNTVFARATSAQYADLAENYHADAGYEPGTVVEFGGPAEVTQCNTDMSPAIAGVISSQPAYLMNSDLQQDHVATVALLGRVPCKVQGKILKGSLLVSAGNGHARAETNPLPGTILGKAVHAFDGNSGTIEIVVGRV